MIRENNLPEGFIGVSKAVPIYKVGARDRKLEYLAWQLRRALVFKKYLPPRQDPDDQADLSLWYEAEEKHQVEVLHAIVSESALTSSVVLLMDLVRDLVR